MHRFDRLEVSLARREVYLDGIPQAISMRAFDILELLIAADGGIVSKEAILAAVWPHAVVIDNNIQVHVSALRKLLGNKAWIKTIAGRGYRLTAPEVVPQDERDASEESDAMRDIDAGQGATSLTSLSETGPTTLQHVIRGPLLIGRESMLADLMTRFSDESLVTLLGAGGVGKSALAFAFARSWCEHTGARLECFDFAGDHLPAREDEAGLASGQEDVACKLSPRWPENGKNTGPILLVLESCERDIAAAIALCQQALAACPEIRVMATSREPLGMAGESLYRVGPLPLPKVDDSDEAARRNPAVQLFLKRGRMLSPHEGDVTFPIQMVATVCRLLDGLPLALELAAQRAELIGLGPLMSQLDASILTLSNGVRSAPRRHRTLQSMLEWSYALLSDIEQAVFRRLSLFDRPFSLGAACNAVSCERLNGEDVFRALYGLISKSLVRMETTLPRGSNAVGAGKCYGMLRFTRHFALDKLIEAGEANWLFHTKGVRKQSPFEPIQREARGGGAAGMALDLHPLRATELASNARTASSVSREIALGSSLSDPAWFAARFSHDDDMSLWYAA